MNTSTLRRKYGIVFVLDALGASSYSDEKIKKFLSARRDLNKYLDNQAKELSEISKIKPPNTYTFGDTLIIVIPLSSKRKIKAHIIGSLILLQNYLYHSLEEGILFRGAFAIGSYIEDPESNTVMGEAVSDAASWYEKSEWMGLSSTPKTNIVLDYHHPEGFSDPLFVQNYPVPMKDGRAINSYTVSWAGRFFQEPNKIQNPRQKFLELIKDQPIPYGVEEKIENTLQYFSFIEQTILTNRQGERTI